MKSHRASGYKHEIERDIVWDLKSRARNTDNATFKEQLRALHLSENTAAMALRIQSRWRANRAKYYVAALLQERQCRSFMEEVKSGKSHLCHLKCKGCLEGEQAAKTTSKVHQLMFADSASVLFGGGSDLWTPRLRVYDTGENWNQRFMEAFELPEQSSSERLTKVMMLNSIDRDFTTAAATYAKTIISEYFLHSKDKSIHPRSMGGVAGGEKYLWRGILFKLADGSSGPWNGSDEAAAKAAGHDLRGNSAYQKAARELDLPLHFPLMALIDYKGFRMTAQAFVPLRKSTPSLVIGSADGGRNVFNSDAKLSAHLSKIADLLRLKVHKCGRETVPLPIACDIEGHVGADGRYYILDLARFMPPEHPGPFNGQSSHMDGFIPDGSEVWVRLPTQDGTHRDFSGNVARAHRIDRSYDVVLTGGRLVRRVPGDRVQDCQMSVFWRLLRPEFVRNRGSDLGVSSRNCGLKSDMEGARKAEARANGGYEPFEDLGAGKLGASSPESSGYSALGSAGQSFSDEGQSTARQAVSGYDGMDTIKEKNAGEEVRTRAPGLERPGKREPAAEESVRDSSSDLKRKPDERENATHMRKTLKGPTGSPKVLEHAPLSRGSYYSFVEPMSENQAANEELSKEPPVAGQQPPSNAQAVAQSSKGNEAVIDAVLTMKTEDDKGSAAGPLSPDALTAFGMHDPDIYEHNRHVRDSTNLLFKQVIPKLAQRLLEQCSSPEFLKSLSLSKELHRSGVNMRHLGLLRKQIPEFSADSNARHLRDLMLREIVGRTLKQLLRDYMRRWMRSERSSSEFGLVLLVTQFLNLTTGAHSNRDTFWNERVVTGIAQRFGMEALTDSDRRDLFGAVSGAASLKAIVKMVCDRCGIVLTHMVQLQFFQDTKPHMFEFNVVDIVKLEAHIKHPGFSELAKSEMLALLAAFKRIDADNGKDSASSGVSRSISSSLIKRADVRVVQRLERQASHSYEAAREKIPLAGALIGEKAKLKEPFKPSGKRGFGEDLSLAPVDDGLASLAAVPSSPAVSTGYSAFPENFSLAPVPPCSPSQLRS